MPSTDFWRGKRVLVTGHSGFKGGWLTLWLHRMGAQVTGISLAPATNPSLFDRAGIDTLCKSHFIDIRNRLLLAPAVHQAAPEIVFHLAAQPLVRASYRDPLGTFETNVLGTAQVLESLRALSSVRVAVMVTTDKVYRNEEWQWPYRETDPLGGHDPYSASKAASEIVIASYRDAFLAEQGVIIGSARAGNVIGGGDWSEDRLIPDAVRAWESGATLQVRRPDATRPWQHVLEPLAGYLVLAERLHDGRAAAGAYNFGPHTSEAASVREVIDLARQAYGAGLVQYGSADAGPHEAGWLALEIAKVRHVIGVEPRWALDATVRRTMAWYRSLREGVDARALCEAEIQAYAESQA